MSDAASMHRRAAEIELEAAARLGCGASRHALAVLRRTALAGRHALDDAALLAQVARLHSESRRRGAAGIVARQVASGKAIAAVERRLRRKSAAL
jgi:hypothetical protein